MAPRSSNHSSASLLPRHPYEEDQELFPVNRDEDAADQIVGYLLLFFAILAALLIGSGLHVSFQQLCQLSDIPSFCSGLGSQL